MIGNILDIIRKENLNHSHLPPWVIEQPKSLHTVTNGINENVVTDPVTVNTRVNILLLLQ